MAAFNRLTEATYEVHESVKVDTHDNEDHTFCGIMFPVKCKDILPVDHISINSLSVRGQLGPMTVWVSKEETPATATSSNRRSRNTNNNNATTVFRLSKSHWHKIYEASHEPSPNEYCTLNLTQPIILKPGQVRAIYIHSTLPGDQAIVYDNSAFYFPRGPFGRHGHANANNARKPRYEDSMIQIHTGRAHVSNTTFGQMPIWGWGNAWRDHREFVGQLHYGAVYQLWNPETQVKFGPKFREALFNLKLCQTRWESPVSKLPDECIYYILNMCRWDWFQDSDDTMTLQQRQRRQKQKELQLEQQQQQQREEAERLAQQAQQRTVEAAADQQRAVEAAVGCCKCARQEDNNSEAEYQDAVENVEEQEDEENEEYDGEVQSMDDDDDDDEWEEEEEEDDDDDDSDDEWEAANGYRADHDVFRFVDPEMEEEEEDDDDDDEDGEGANRQAWLQRQFQRIHVLRALARQQDDDEDVVDMHLVF